MLTAIQNELFDLGADLATPGEDFAPSEMTLRIVQPQIDRLEREIDSMNEGLEPLRSFILPGGGGGAAAIHLARAIVRRAERSAIAASAAAAAQPARPRLPEPPLRPSLRHGPAGGGGRGRGGAVEAGGDAVNSSPRRKPGPRGDPPKTLVRRSRLSPG